MKAIIVEIKGSNAAALCDNSSIVKIPNKNYVVGQQVELVAKKKTRSIRRISAAAACIAMFFGLSATGYAAVTPYSYVTLDVNPSFEYTLNRFDQVIKVESVNDDAQDVLDELDIPKFASLDKVLKLTIDELYNEGYLTEDEKDIMLLSVCSDKESKSDELSAKIAEVTDEYKAESDVIEVTEEDRQTAIDHNTTAGKLSLILDVIEKNDKVTEKDIDELVDKSVKQIKTAMDKSKKPSKDTKEPTEVSENNNGNGNDSHKTPASSVAKDPSKGNSGNPSADNSSKNPSNGGGSNSGSNVKPEDPTDTPVVTPPAPTDDDDIDDSDITGPGK